MPTAPANSIVNGFSLRLVKFSAVSGGNLLGTFSQMAPRKWMERDRNGKEVFQFEETARDEWSVYLRDVSRNVFLQIDLFRKLVLYSDQSTKSVPLYATQETTNKITGWLLDGVKFTSQHSLHRSGEFRQTGKNIWVEFDRNGDAVEGFEETGRDEWSVYLKTLQGNQHVQIDQHREIISWSVPGGQRRDEHFIIRASAVQGTPHTTPPLSGMTVNAIETVSSDGSPYARFRKIGSFNWAELNATGQETFYFTEKSHHKGAIFLHDASRNVTLHFHLNSRKVHYRGPRGEHFELCQIKSAASKVNGFVVNRASFRSFDGTPLGEYRQTGVNTWSEMDARQRAGFWFVETHRDEWSVYLHDASRNVSIQIDLHRGKIVYSDAKAHFDLYDVQAASTKPGHVIPRLHKHARGFNVNTIAFSALNGKPLGYYRQTGTLNWVETGPHNEVRFQFREVKRGRSVVELRDDSRGVSLQINLHTKKIHYSDGRSEFDLYTVDRAYSQLNGWLVSEATFGGAGNNLLGRFRQTAPKHWAEFNKNDQVAFHFREVRRQDWSIFLFDDSRGVSLELNLRLGWVIYGDKDNRGLKLYPITEESVEPDYWLHSEQITSRSAMTEDFDVEPGQSNLKSRPVYRTSVSLSKVTSSVDVWASEEVTVEINGAKHTIDPVKSANVTPDAFRKLSISVPATDVHCPSLRLRTNLMLPDELHYIFPDVEAHKKIVSLQPGDLAGARQKLGIPDTYSDADVGHFQTALQNIAKTVQHTYNEAPQGVHHDRALLPANMDHPHFTVDFGGGAVRYQPLNHTEVAVHIGNPRVISDAAAQNIFDSIGHFFSSAATVVVHTVTSVGGDIVKSVENVGKDVVQTVSNFGEDIIHGDILHAGQDLLQGGENLGKDLMKGAAGVAGDLVSGAGQLVVLTIKAADDAVQFVLTHTGAVGKVLGMLFEKIGAALEKVVDWLLDKIGWRDVLKTHDFLLDLVNHKLDDGAGFVTKIKQKGDNFFTQLSDQVVGEIDKALATLNPAGRGYGQPQPAASHSGAVEKIEWFLGKLSQNATGGGALAFPSGGVFGALTGGQRDDNSPMGRFLGLVEQQVSADGPKFMSAIEEAVGDLRAMFSSTSHTPDYLLGALLEVAKAGVILGIDVVKVVFDAVMDLIVSALESFKTMLNAPWNIPFISSLYSVITEGRQMTFLSMVCLLLALPTTLFAKAALGRPPFQSDNAGASLAPIGQKPKDLAIVYSTCHMVLSITSVTTDVRTAASGFGGSMDRVLNDADVAEVNASPAEFSKIDSFMTVLNVGVGFIAQMMANPIPAGDSYVMPLDQAKNDVFEAPNYWSHVVWMYQWAGWSANALLSGAIALAPVAGFTKGSVKGMGNFSTVLNCVYGVVHMGLMANLDVCDRRKRDALGWLDTDESKRQTDDQIFTEIYDSATKKGHSAYVHLESPGKLSNGSTTADWVSAARNYYEWSKIPADGGIPSKGYGNIMDTFPEIGQIGAMPYLAEETMGISVVVTGALDLLGHMGEGITYAVRTARDELL